MSFAVEAVDGAARAGVLRTAHGEIRTPAFMPVGTKGTVKTLLPSEVRALGADVILGNTYHLHLRPGEDVVEDLGGLHAFTGWDGPILTDSGGFQVFSLRDTLVRVDDDGVTFRSVYDGNEERLTPEGVAEIQTAARVGHRDVPRHLPARGRAPTRARGSRAPDAALGRAAGRRPARSGPAPLRYRAGWHRRRAPRAVDRADSSSSPSTGSRSEGSRWGRAATRCSVPSAGPHPSFLQGFRGTSWVSATRRGSSR